MSQPRAVPDLPDLSARGRANRRKGGDAERELVAFLRNHGWPDARRYLAGDGNQPGDIDGIPGLVIEVRNRQALSIDAGLRDADRQAGPDRQGILVVRPYRTPSAGDWWVIQRCRDYFPLWRPDR